MRQMFWHWTNIKILFKKDLSVEARHRQGITTACMFAVVALMIVTIAVGGEPVTPKIRGGLLWVVIFFAALAGLDRSFTREKDQGTLWSLYMFAEAQAVLIGKFLYNTVLLLCLLLVLLPLYILFMDLEIAGPEAFFLVLLIGSIGIALVLTFTAAITAMAGGRSSLFCIVSFPLLLPLFMLVIQLTEGSIVSPIVDWQQLSVLLAYDGAVGGIASILFDYLWEE